MINLNIMKASTNIHNVLEGCLLGDGHLERMAETHNACFNYGSSSKEHTDYVHSFFKEYCSENYKKPKRVEVYDKRTNKTYVRYWFRTKHLPLFTNFHKLFYRDRIKIIPENLNISEASLLFWYIGDGELESHHGYIKLHTNSFKKEEVKSLCKLLGSFEARTVHKEKNQYIISIPRKNVKKFLSYIGDCPIKDYSHKWKETPYKNKNIELNGVNNYSILYPKIEKEFQNKTLTIYQLHKKYNVPIKSIKHFFETHNIIWKPIDNKKKVIQYAMDGSIIKEWHSGQEIHKKEGYNASAISECCRGIRKNYKGYFWKFKNKI